MNNARKTQPYDNGKVVDHDGIVLFIRDHSWRENSLQIVWVTLQAASQLLLGNFVPHWLSRTYWTLKIS